MEMKKIVSILWGFFFPISTLIYAESKSDYSQKIREGNLKQALPRPSFYAHPIWEKNNSLNRLGGYFAPQGISILNSEKLTRALQEDELLRQQHLFQIQQTIQNRMEHLETRRSENLQSILNSKGELGTYDLSKIRNVSQELQVLIQDSNQLKTHIQKEFKIDLFKNALRPYEPKNQIWTQQKKAEKTIAGYLEGPYLNGGLKGFEESLWVTQRHLSETALALQQAENKMQENLIQNTFLGSIAFATSLVTLIPSGGSSASLWVASLESANSAIGLGNTIRNQIILSEKGLEGFRSEREAWAGEVVQNVQGALQVAIGAIQLPETLKSIKPTASSKTISVVQALSHLNQISEWGGLKQKALGNDGSFALNAFFALNHFLDYDSHILGEPADFSKKSVILKRNLNQLENIYTALQGIPAVRNYFEENPKTQFLMPTLALAAEVRSKYLDRTLFQQLKGGAFRPNQIQDFFDLNALSSQKTQEYRLNPENQLALEAAYETALYGKQTQMDPYVLQKKSKEGVETKYFVSQVQVGDPRIPLSQKESALLASLYKQNPALNSYNLKAINHYSTEDRKDFYFTLSHSKLEKVLQEEEPFIAALIPEKTFEIKGNGSGIKMGPYQSYQTPLGLVYGGEVHIHSSAEKFSLPEVATLNSVAERPLRVFGGGTIQIKEEPLLKYSDLYTFRGWKQATEIYSSAIGQNKGGLFLGIGSPREALESPKSRLGFILPTGSGILLEPTFDKKSYSIVYQALNLKWSSLFMQPDLSLTENYLTSKNFEKNLKTNPLKYFFMDGSKNPLAAVNSGGEISLASLAQFYEKRDPTGGGIYEMSQRLSTPYFQEEEAATRNGLHIKQFWNLSGFKETGAQWNLPIYKNYWSPFRALYQNSFLGNSFQYASWENGLTVETYWAKGSLNLESLFFNRWREKSQIVSQKTEVWTNYEQNLHQTRENLNAVISQLSRAPWREKNNFISAEQIYKIHRAAHTVSPLIKKSYRALTDLEPSFTLVLNTGLLDKKAILQFKAERNLLEKSYQALNSLPVKLNDWNKFSHSIRLNNEIFDTSWDILLKRDQLWHRIDSNLSTLTQTANIFNVPTAPLIERFQSRMTESSLLRLFTASAIEYKRATASLKASPFFLASALKFAANGVYLEGIEEKNYALISMGYLGKYLIVKIPTAQMGERMINLYALKPPTRRELIQFGVGQVWDDLIKYNKLARIIQLEAEFK